MSYDEWLAEVADQLNVEPEELEEMYPQIKALVYDAGASPNEGADCIRSGM